MGTFGIRIGSRSNAASFGGISQQSITNPANSITTTPQQILGPSSRAPSTSAIVTVRNIPIATISPDIIQQVKPPPLVKFISPSIKFIPKIKKYEQDSLRISQYRIQNNKFEAVEKNGISVFRPEIISMMNFSPIDGNSRLGSRAQNEGAEQLIKAHFQAIEIRATTIQRLMADIRTKNEYKIQLDNIKNKFANGLSTTEITLSYFSDLIDKISIIQTSFDPKEISQYSFDTVNFLSLRDFYERKMQYPKNRFANFSDTKIINQLISDFRNILEGYSLALFDLVDPDRKNDVSPIKIDKSYTQTNGFSFSLASVRSTASPRMAFKSDFFNQFINSLPSNSDDRIKLLVHFLSKELRVSKAMGNNDLAATLRTKYSQNDSGNPFDNIVGEVGDTIFNLPRGQNSLASLTIFSLDANNLVLPFESVYVDSEDERKVYVPGSTYFVDSILTVTNNGFNTQPYVSYVNNFNNVVSDAKNTIEALLDLKQNSSLSPTNVYDIFLNSITEAIAGLTSASTSASGINRSQALCVAVFELANSDSMLKNMLFEYLLLLGLASISSLDQKKIFMQLANEVGRIQNFNFAKATTREQPILNGGIGVIRPYIENVAEQIEDRIFTLLNTNLSPLFDRAAVRSFPSLLPTTISNTTSGPIRTLSPSSVGLQNFGLSKIAVNIGEEGYQITFSKGEIKDTLLNTITTTGISSTNLCKEFIDIAVKLDQLASVSSNQTYLLQDGSGRTRQNYFSTSTILLFIFEILSSFVNQYTFAIFSKGITNTAGSVIVNTSMMDSVYKIIKDIVSAKQLFSIGKEKIINTTRLTGPFSLFNLDAAKESIVTSENSTKQSQKTARDLPAIYSPNISSITTIPNANIQTIINSPAFGFGNAIKNIPFNFSTIKDIIRSVNIKKNLLAIRTKLNDEDKIIKNILHIFSVINKKLITSKEEVIKTFTVDSLNNFLSSTGTSLGDISIVKNPTQVRLSSWIYDIYDNKMSNVGENDTTDEGVGFIFTDRIPIVNLNAMFSMLREGNFLSKAGADYRVKILTVGIPAGFSKMLSDRISKTSISETNFKNKQFDVISINVYKRDARFDDIVFKPQKFLFDLSLFTAKNFIPDSLNYTSLKFSDVVLGAILRDYEFLKNKKDLKLDTIRRDPKYAFLTNQQKYELFQNHIRSELLKLYIKLMAGIEISEEIFTATTYDKTKTQNEEVYNLILSYLRNVRRKQIPNQSISQILQNPNVDQETKDVLRLLSYGNLIFQPDFIRRRILEPKLFDRVFHLPLFVDDFEIDVEATKSTEAGKNAYVKNSIQNVLYERNGKVYLRQRNKNDTIFEDYFVVIESDLGGGK